MKSAFTILLSFWLAFSNTAFAHSHAVSAANKKDSSGYFSTAASVFGLVTNSLAILSGAYTLRSFDRRKATPGKYINLALTALEVLTHSANLIGFGSEISDKLATATDKTEAVASSWRSSKLLGLNMFGLLFHLSNFLFIERKGCAQLFHFHDLWEILGHANDIRANSDVLKDSLDHLMEHKDEV